MHLIWPPDQARPLDDEALERLYTYPATSKWLAINYVSSADGAVEVGGTARGLSNPPDRKVLRLGSDLADVVLVGAQTAMVEGFHGVHPDAEAAARRRRHDLAAVPPTAVVTTGQTLPADAPVITEASTPTIVFTCAATPVATRHAWADAGAEVIVVGEATVDLSATVRALTDQGLHRIDCEGGPTLTGALFTAGLIDELRLTVSPLVTSGMAGRITTGPPIEPIDMQLATALAQDDVLLLRYLTGR